MWLGPAALVKMQTLFVTWRNIKPILFSLRGFSNGWLTNFFLILAEKSTGHSLPVPREIIVASITRPILS